MGAFTCCCSASLKGSLFSTAAVSEVFFFLGLFLGAISSLYSDCASTGVFVKNRSSGFLILHTFYLCVNKCVFLNKHQRKGQHKSQTDKLASFFVNFNKHQVLPPSCKVAKKMIFWTSWLNAHQVVRWTYPYWGQFFRVSWTGQAHSIHVT